MIKFSSSPRPGAAAINDAESRMKIWRKRRFSGTFASASKIRSAKAWITDVLPTPAWPIRTAFCRPPVPKASTSWSITWTCDGMSIDKVLRLAPICSLIFCPNRSRCGIQPNDQSRAKPPVRRRWPKCRTISIKCSCHKIPASKSSSPKWVCAIIDW